MNRRYQFFPAVIILATVFVLSGCSGKKDRIFFEAEELSKIELYRFIIPSDAEKKVASDQEEFIDIRTEDIEGFISDNTTQSDRLEDASGSSNAEENANNGRASMVGRCLISTDGQYLIIDENGAPIVLSNQSENEQMFEKLQSGDKIQITFDGIQETYPAQTGVYTCELLEKGSMEEIPTETVGSLQELGWTF